jgi:hypothetical protein
MRSMYSAAKKCHHCKRKLPNCDSTYPKCGLLKDNEIIVEEYFSDFSSYPISVFAIVVLAGIIIVVAVLIFIRKRK